MWQPDKAGRISNKDLVVIHSDYDELIFHDLPILYTGRNSYDDRIVGSFLDHAEDSVAYLHSIVDEKTYSRFENRLINYLELLKRARFIFHVSFDSEAVQPTLVNFDEIPEEYLPSETAAHPESTVKASSVEIEARFRGGRSEQHLVTPETASTFTKNWAKLIRGIFLLDGFKGFSPSVFLKAVDGQQLLAEGSLKINYHVDLAEKKPSLFFDASDYAPFIEAYVTYCLHHLTREAPQLAKGEMDGLNAFQQLTDLYVATFRVTTLDRGDKQQRLAKNLLKANRTLGELSEVVGSDVKQIEFKSLAEAMTQSLGVFDGQSVSEVEHSLEEVAEVEGKVMMRDDTVTDHTIHIYELNVNTRTGRALLPPDQDKIAKPRIVISGDEPLSNTKYTRSLHEDTMITVKARASRIDNKITKLDIEFENDD